MARGRPAGNPFSALDEEFKEAVAAATTEALKTQFGQVAKNEVENQAAMKADPDLKSLRAQAADAGAQYREATKANKQRLKFILRVLGDRGDEQAQEIMRLTLAGK
jgi:hypothetical protein